jgi:hypothetical protein
LRRIAAVGVGASLAGCGLWRPVEVPMPVLGEPAPCAARPDAVFVMSPGSYSRPEDFVTERFVAAVRARGLAADLLLADAHLGYYREHSILDRLHDDVIAPARAHGYRQVWLVGISVGAFGALAYAEAHPDDIAGIVAIGPYLGKRPTTDEIRAQGGLATWQAAAGPVDPSDLDRTVWRWLQPYATGSAPRPPLFLGYGRSDRFVADDHLLAAALPPDRVFSADGGHDWDPWRAVWGEVLDALPIPHSCR